MFDGKGLAQPSPVFFETKLTKDPAFLLPLQGVATAARERRVDGDDGSLGRGTVMDVDTGVAAVAVASRRVRASV